MLRFVGTNKMRLILSCQNGRINQAGGVDPSEKIYEKARKNSMKKYLAIFLVLTMFVALLRS